MATSAEGEPPSPMLTTPTSISFGILMACLWQRGSGW
jgi:hypothetical protein